MARKPIPAEGASSDDFGRQVRDALAHLYDPAFLQTHPLAALVPADASARTPGRGKALRQILIEAIDATRPVGAAEGTRPDSVIHRVLTLHYVEALEPAEVQEQLAIGRSEYYREHQKGLDAVVSLLWERWGSGHEAADRATSPQDATGETGRIPDPATRHNLPIQPTSFIGRERELAAIEKLLLTARLVTLTGAGGCGKTRLALRVAAHVAGSFPGGVWFVDLAPLADPLLVLPTVMTILGVADVPGRPPLASLTDFLRRRTALLVLDNCEHLVEATARLAEALIQSCPDARVLATSREALGVDGELIWRVPSLSLPDPGQTVTVVEAEGSEAVQLFIQRARLVQPDFELTPENAAVLGQICRRLDGIPFAIELAAARTRMMTVEQIAARLDDRFSLLTGGKRTALRRHQTLRALVDWSYELLPEDEQRLLRRLSVFAGGWTLEAVEAVCSDPLPATPPDAEIRGRGDAEKGTVALSASPLPPISMSEVGLGEVLDLLSALVDKSLVVAESEGEHERYRLLETLREYALERLAASGEAEDVRSRHATHYLTLAGQVAAEVIGRRLPIRDARQMQRDLNNVRAALRWAIDYGQVEEALQLCGALGWSLYLLSRPDETRRWLAELLAAPAAREPTVGRGRALVSAGRLASNQFEPEAADTLLDEALTILRARGDLGGIAEALAVKARAAVSRQDYLAARVMAEEAVTIAATHGDPELVAEARMMLAQACFYLGDYPDARRCLEEVVVYCASSGRFYPHGLLDWSGHVETACGDYVAARERYRESMRQRLMVDRQIGVAFTLSGFAGLAAAEGDLRRAARLSGTAARLCDLSGVPAHRTQEGYIRDRLPRIRAALGDAAYDAAWDEGQAMTLEEAVADALGGDAD